MGTSASERIAVEIVTTADLAGMRAARQDVGALGRESKAAADQMATASQRGASAERSLAAATHDAVVEQDKFALSTAKGRELLAQAGGDYTKFLSLVKQHVDSQRQLAAATAEAAAAQRTQNAVLAGTPHGPWPSGPPAGPFGPGGPPQGPWSSGPVQGPALPPGGLSSESAAAVKRVADQVDRLPATMTKATRGFGALAFAMQQGTGNATSLAMASGHLITEFGAMSGSAAIAAGSAGLGAVVTVAVIATAALLATEKAANATDLALARIGKVSLTQIDKQIAQQRQVVDEAQKGYLALVEKMGLRGSVGPWSEQGKAAAYLAQQEANLTALIGQRVKLQDTQGDLLDNQQHANTLLIADSTRTLELETLRTFQLKVQAGWYDNLTTLGQAGLQKIANQQAIVRREIELEGEGRAQAIKETFRQVDANGAVVALTKEQQAQMDLLLARNTEMVSLKQTQVEAEERIARATARNALALEKAGFEKRPGEAFDLRLEQIDIERQAEIKKTGDIAAANERAEFRIRQLRRQTYTQVIDDLGSIADATIDQQNRSIRAIGHGADTIRKLMIGAQAAHAAVEAAIEWGKSIGSLATGDFRGAALHAASAAQLTAAAAMGAREALGAGPSGGGGGGAVGPSLSTRDPREAGSNTTLIIQTVNPFSREVLGETVFQINRSGTLKTPTYAPPMSGITTYRAA